MRLQASLLLLASSGFVFGCGDSGEDDTDAGMDGGGYYAFSSGTYAVTNALSPSTDQCGLLAAYQDPAKKIGVSVSGDTVTFNLSNDSSAPANSLPTATLTGNTLAQLSEANYTTSFTNPDCVVRIKRNVTGSVVDDNVAALTLSFNVATETGTCNGTNTAFDAVPCASSYQFTATKE